MGGTYPLSNFEDRLSQYPTRRKLIHNSSDEDNVYSVQRDEGVITQEGIAFSAQFMNNFDNKIADMFPVSVENGGTGATTGDKALKNLGLIIESGTFTPKLVSNNPNSNEIKYVLFQGQDQGYELGYYSRMGDICQVNVNMKIYVTDTGKKWSENAYLTIKELPFQSQTDMISQPLAVGELSSFGALQSEGGLANIPINSRQINLLQQAGQVSQWFKGINSWVWVRVGGAYLCN
jgi:hypothetical protein